MVRGNRPSIFQIGKVQDLGGGRLLITGWGLGQCTTGCNCHRRPITGSLHIDEDQDHGRLGLVSYRNGGCTCCDPWTAYELADILRDLADIEALSADVSGT